MKLLITSDIHGNIEILKQLIEKQKDITNHFDAGDSQLEEDLLLKYNVQSVKGNTDYNSRLPLSKTFIINNKKICIIHGHTLNVKLTYVRLKEFAKYNKIDIVIFGHTHIPLIKKEDKVLFINPGSLGYDNTYVIYENEEARLYKLNE